MWWHNGNQCFWGVSDFKTSTRYKMYFIPEKALSTLLPFIYWMVLPAWPPSTSNLISSVVFFLLLFMLSFGIPILINNSIIPFQLSKFWNPRTLFDFYFFLFLKFINWRFFRILPSLITDIHHLSSCYFLVLSHPFCFAWSTAMASGPFVFNFSMRLTYYI